MLPPDYLAHVTDDIIVLYEAYEDALIADMARRIAKMGVSATSVWQMKIYQEAGGVYEDALKEISALTGKSTKELRRAFETSGLKSIAYDDSIYKAAGLNPIPIMQSPAMLNILLSGLQKTSATIGNLTATTAVTSQSSFIQAATMAHMQVSSGAMSYTQAIRNAIKSIADDGLYVLYPTGHRDKIDVAMRRAVLTGVSQTTGQFQWSRVNEMGAEFVETTAHLGARPSHAPWQGRVFHVGGAIDGYEDFVSATGYGSGDGLMGWNCYHSYYPFFPAYSSRNYTNAELDEMNNKTAAYNGDEISWTDATQKQRKFERDIRKTKRELSALDGAMQATTDNALKLSLRDEFNVSSVRLSDQKSRLNDFLDQTGMPRQQEREQVHGFGRSTAQKAVWGAKKGA